jgi:hypothetical protein
MKKTPTSRLSKKVKGGRSPVEAWHGGCDIEIRQYALSLQNAARTLVGQLEADHNARTDLGAGPVVLLYRQALEIHLKLLVGEGSNFLRSPTDPISLSTTHSLRWLAQIVCQIIKKIGWESEFKCEGVSSLVEFSALVNEVEIFDPVPRAIRHSRTGDPHSISQYFRTFDIFQFAKSLDALLELLDSTADALAAEWDRRVKAAAAFAELGGGDDFKATIQ